MDLTVAPTAALYALLAILTAGTGVGVIVYQTGATTQALLTRRGLLAIGVVLVLIGGLVLLAQLYAILTGSYSTLPNNAP